MAGGQRFRLPYKKRKYYHRYNRDNPVINIHVGSLVNPFDAKNGQPKWPDGKATFSIGRRHQLTSEIYHDDFYVILFPGAINWCVAFAKHFDNTHSKYIPQVYANHTANISINYEYNRGETTTTDTENTEYRLEIAHDAFSHWRNVATAMHLQVINTTDTNEGWFRAVRMTREKDNRDMFNTVMGIGSEYGNGNHINYTPHFHTGGVLPNNSFLEEIETFFENSPTFCCGELQDIHNAVFQLNETKKTNDFVVLETAPTWCEKDKELPIFKRDDRLWGTKSEEHWEELFQVEQKWTGVTTGNYRTSRANWHLLSDCKDMILLHVIGAANTKILLHSVNNQEFLCNDSSQLAQYLTPCHYDKAGLENYNKNRNWFHKFPFHYLSNIESTGKAIPAPYYTSQQFHYDG